MSRIRRVPVAEHVERDCGGTPRNRREVDACCSVGKAACCVGDYELAERLLSAAREAASTHEFGKLELMARAELAMLDFSKGTWDGLDAAVAALTEDVAEFEPARVDVEVIAGCLALARGDVDSAKSRLTVVADALEAQASIDLLPMAVGALARLAVARDDPVSETDRVTRLFEALDAKGTWAPVVRALPWGVQALIAVGRIDDSRSVLSRSSRRLRGLDAPLATPALRFAHGFLDAAAGEWQLAAVDFMAAAKLYELCDCHYEAALAHEQAALALAETSSGRAQEEFDAALTVLRKLGAGWDIARCARGARARGARIPAPYRGGRKGYGDALSPRERQVARLAATGLRNKDIGAELFLSPRTVEKHLGRAMRKLGINSRAALAMGLPSG